MAYSVNQVSLLGNVGKDPESKSLPSGTAVCSFSMATSEQWKDKTTGEKKEKTEWHNIVCFDRLAEILGQYLAKGNKVYVSGKLQTRKWQDKNGNDRYTTEVVAREAIILTPRDKDERPAAAPAAAPAPAAERSYEDDDIPF